MERWPIPGYEAAKRPSRSSATWDSGAVRKTVASSPGTPRTAAILAPTAAASGVCGTLADRDRHTRHTVEIDIVGHHRWDEIESCHLAANEDVDRRRNTHRVEIALHRDGSFFRESLRERLAPLPRVQAARPMRGTASRIARGSEDDIRHLPLRRWCSAGFSKDDQEDTINISYIACSCQAPPCRRRESGVPGRTGAATSSSSVWRVAIRSSPRLRQTRGRVHRVWQAAPPARTRQPRITLPYRTTGPLSYLALNCSPSSSEKRRAIEPSGARKLNMRPFREV